MTGISNSKVVRMRRALAKGSSALSLFKIRSKLPYSYTGVLMSRLKQ